MRYQALLLLFALTFGPAPELFGQSIRVTLLGTGTPRPEMDRMGPATLIQAGEEVLLFDAGRGVSVRLVEAGVDPSDISAVFVTHHHSDHVTGLPDLWLLGHTPPWFRNRPLEVFGPTGTAAMTANIAEAFSRDVQIRANPSRPGPALVGEDHQGGVVYESGGVKVTAIPVDHVPDSYGYRVDFGGRSVVLSGDARPTEALARAAEGSDLFIHEIMAIAPRLLENAPPPMRASMQGVLETHTTPAQLAEVFAATGPRLGVLTHVALNGVSEEEALAVVRAGYRGRVVMGHDLMSVEVGDEVIVRD